MVIFELETTWSSRLWYHVKEPSQPNNLSFLGEVLGYDLYYSLTGNTTITDIFINENSSSVFYRDLKKLYWKYHNHRCLCKWIQFIGISPRVEKYLLHIPLLPTRYWCRYISSENLFLHTFSVCKTIGIFFIDKMWNYRWTLCRQTLSIGDLVGKKFTDEVTILHRRIGFLNKIIKCCSVTGFVSKTIKFYNITVI
jgi:hypothetical protein